MDEKQPHTIYVRVPIKHLEIGAPIHIDGSGDWWEVTKILTHPGEPITAFEVKKLGER